ncbi:hypothetical protein BGX34_004713 [Mortierella sp. NVP85]|nr:hypothetical protein BGX34_004713 [Mortierella sp. NVP85]
MIQCETCKVWQHCPCVGLGDGEVTPDQYYCESCRPENHPYKVLNGQLISNPKPSSAQKPTKKRSTMNSKEASIPMELTLAQQKWNEEHQGELDDEFAVRASSKRRRKTESSNADLNDDIFKSHESSKDKDTDKTSSVLRSSVDKRERLVSSEHDIATTSPGSPTSTSPKTHTSHNGRMGSKKAKTTSKSRSRSNSPKAGGHNASHSHNQESANGRPDGGDDSKRAISSEDSSSPTKRRKAHPSTLDDEDFVSKDTTEDCSDMHTRSRKTGGSSRHNSKRTISHDEHDYIPYESTSNGNGSSISSPPPVSKKSFSKRGGDRGQRNGSRPSTPTPNREGTPQPLAPAAPATVRYPSSKMTLQEMTKRAKQLLDYISRVQIDMADRKSKSGSQSPTEDNMAAALPMCESSLIHPDPSDHHVCRQEVSELKEPTLFRLPPSSASTGNMHDDSQVCPDLSRSSMDSTASSVESLHEPSSPHDAKLPIRGAGTGSVKEMTIKVVPLNGQVPHPLLSTPPLSVHDHHDHHRHSHGRHGSGTPESEAAHEPLTPPHQPSETHDEQSSRKQGEDMDSLSTKKEPTSMELMDKLTGDLIRFQERFGGFV